MNNHLYVRPVHYYETDQMGIVHHSNYIRWFEDARLDLMKKMGIDYKDVEQAGILIPVVDISCKYLVSAKYGGTVTIAPVITAYSGVKLCFRYEVRRISDNELIATGTSTHCFVNCDRRPISLRRHAPELHRVFTAMQLAE